VKSCMKDVLCNTQNCLSLAKIHLAYIFACNVIKLYIWDAPQLDVQITFVGGIYTMMNLYELLEY
jgi:hypothetical protein